MEKIIIIPEVGMGATILEWTDRTACTIIEIGKSPIGVVNKIVVQEDFATRLDNNGMSESQEYSYTPNPDGNKTTFTLRKNGTWQIQNFTTDRKNHLMIGDRLKYHDYSF